jgi:hypothetical protein
MQEYFDTNTETNDEICDTRRGVLFIWWPLCNQCDCCHLCNHLVCTLVYRHIHCHYYMYWNGDCSSGSHGDIFITWIITIHQYTQDVPAESTCMIIKQAPFANMCMRHILNIQYIYIYIRHATRALVYAIHSTCVSLISYTSTPCDKQAPFANMYYTS